MFGGLEALFVNYFERGLSPLGFVIVMSSICDDEISLIIVKRKYAMKTSGIAYANKMGSIPGSGTEILEMSLLCGKDKDEKTRYLNGGFIVTNKTEGLRAVERALSEALAKGEKGVMVSYEIAELHAVPAAEKDGTRIFTNYRGLVNKVHLYTPKGKD